ncbi:MAG: TadE/TadG family type IV pilus assembly protein [Acidimicrobiales bacterium]
MIFHRGPKGRARQARDDEGSVLVEFSFVFVLFVLVIYALVSFGMILATKNSLTHAAAEGARAAISVIDDLSTPAVDEREQRALDQIGTTLDWLGGKYQPADASADIAACSAALPAGPQCITVRIIYPYETRPIVPPAPGLGLVTPKTLTSTAVVELS